ncbi:MAG: hypothetical protein P8H91_01440 [Flavobacteriaceae bacterium]|jgi:hypothetical protein|nr:hypothetical protein [Flavobacteriaceae bacterium]MDG2290297.1 hypothetical protein [Flavobacteriaceae bacterium]
MANLRITLQIFLAATFLFSAYTKAVAPGFFEVLLEQQGLVPSRLYGAWATRFIIALETWLGLCLLLSFYSRFILRFSFLLLVAFSVHLGYLIAIGETGNCGCFGEMISMSPLASLGKNIVLLAVNCFLLRYKFRGNKKPRITWLLLPLLFAAATLIWPVQTQPDEVVEKLPTFEAETGIDFANGSYLVAILNLGCEHCQEAAQQIVAWQNNGIDLPQVAALFFAEGDTTVADFNTITGSNFPYQMIDVNTFFDLIGSTPPRIYWIVDGQVKQYWDETLGEDFLTTFAP